MQSFCIEERGTYKNNSGTGLKRRVEFLIITPLVTAAHDGRGPTEKGFQKNLKMFGGSHVTGWFVPALQNSDSLQRCVWLAPPPDTH